ncbi:DUF4374 domain-containing protein [Pedobacter deserti]|uniref:DUF4374 domain-containing protein n=1 Tax=Pedobacter deserti TaxID=2817382 RepID=UPI00210DA752|nr:DUF4374 domain-containing protein [Pedobacter sp. SYSU D00382]
MKTTITKTLAALAFAAVLTSCSKRNEEIVPENPGNFVLAVTPIALEGVADYLVTAGNLDEGTVSIIGNGVEQDGTYRYYVTANNKFFSMLYGQGNPGAVTAYNIVGGKLNKLTNFVTETVQAFAPVKDDILMVKVPRSIASTDGNPTASALWYRVNTNTTSIVGEGTLDALAPAANGEIAHFSWIKQVGDKVWMPFFSITGRNFWTKHPDEAWIAVYSYPDMQLEKVIKDDRTSFIGKYFTDGLSVQENGDVYAYSPAAAADDNVESPETSDSKFTSTKPSAITRLKSGTTEFDKSYFFNFETASGGYVITNWMYLGQDKYIANVVLKNDKDRDAYTDGKQLAIVNVADQTVKLVTGFPDPESVEFITTNNYTPKDGKYGYIGVNLNDGTTWIYKIDASTASATRGLKVEGGKITAIQHLQ